MATVVLLTASLSALAAPEVWTVAEGGNGNAYDFGRVGGAESGWTGAQQVAQRTTFRGVTGHLAVITSQAENNFIARLLAFRFGSVAADVKPEQLWIGGVQSNPLAAPAVGWGWITGEPWAYTNWAAGEPNDDSGRTREEYLGMWAWSARGPRGSWNDNNDTDVLTRGWLIIEYSLHDCNDDGVPDDLEIGGDALLDANDNLQLDVCEPDCNENGIPDVSDIADQTSADCDANGVPDDCEPDCNETGRTDACDIATGDSEDCNGNGVPDECDVRAGPDCNDNAIPDICEPDCNGNGIPDDCEQGDCDDDGTPDACEPDCNRNGVPDACDLTAGTSQDCNANGRPDDCEADCNGNGVADSCEIADGTAPDANGTGIPDECEPPVVFVDAAAAGLANGTSWENAFTDLQAALSLARAADGAVREIWVAAGIYHPDRGTAKRTASFQLLDGVALLGGFAGTETAREQRDPLRSLTILSGDLAGDDGPRFANNNENSYHVVLGSGTDNTAVLDGFVITRGNANGSCCTPDNASGAGLYIENGAPTIAGCTFVDHASREDGGALLSLSSHATLTHCTFQGNTSLTNGGAIANADSSLTIVGCVFRGNLAGLWGGALVNGSTSTTLARRCVFEGNMADRGGAIANASGDVTTTSASFVGNIAGHTGGAVFARGGSVTLIRSDVRRNAAEWGGGIFVDVFAALTLVNCHLDGNRASTRAGGVHAERSATVAMANCTVTGNAAVFGGGVYIRDGASGVLTSCTIHANIAGSRGGGVDTLRDGAVKVTNSILWGNQAAGRFTEGTQVTVGASVVDHTCVQGLTGALGGVGNIGADPQFLLAAGIDNVPGTADDVLGFSPASPCVNAGDNGALPRDTSDLDGDGDSREPIPVDLAGGPRILRDVVDMGAFEVGDCNRNGVLDAQDIADGISLDRDQNGLPDECELYRFGDVDGDGDIDLADFLFLIQCFDGPRVRPSGEGCCRVLSRRVPCESPADLDGDEDVDLSDLLIFQSMFTGPQ